MTSLAKRLPLHTEVPPATSRRRGRRSAPPDTSPSRLETRSDSMSVTPELRVADDDEDDDSRDSDGESRGIRASREPLVAEVGHQVRAATIVTAAYARAPEPGKTGKVDSPNDPDDGGIVTSGSAEPAGQPHRRGAPGRCRWDSDSVLPGMGSASVLAGFWLEPPKSRNREEMRDLSSRIGDDIE